MHRYQHKDFEKNIPLINGKAAEISDWGHRGPRTVDFYNMHYNWGEIAAEREQPEKMGTVTTHQEFTNIYFLEREEMALLERRIIRNWMIVEECRKKV